MCKTNKRTYGVELEGYTRNNLIGDSIENWDFVADGSLEEGEEQCGDCEGSGERYYACPNCDGTQSVMCEECGGDNDIPCGNCDCEGGSEDINGDWVDCEDCDGEGYIRCEYCDNGEIECDICDSDGEVMDECHECCGSGCYGSDGDGSGVECVSGILNEGDYEPIDIIFNHIEREDWNVREDCGTHVHIGAKDLSPSELSRVAILTHILEPIIFGSVSRDRLYSRWCQKTNASMISEFVRVGDDVNKQQIANLYYGREVDLGGYFGKYDGARYYGLNIHSYFLRGTLEFRYFDGSEDKEEVKGWVDLCTKIVDFGKYASFEQLNAIANELVRIDNLNVAVEKITELLDLEYNIVPKSPRSYEDTVSNVTSELYANSQQIQTGSDEQQAV